MFQLKKWRVRSARPENKCNGMYLTKENAEEALNHYQLTGECMSSDRIKRKRGTGNIKKKHNGRYRARYTRNKIHREKTFDTPEQCEEWLKSELNY